jgi:hypothetical protein
MQEIIIAGDDEVDLCNRNKRVSKKVFVLSCLTMIAFVIVVFQQWQGLFAWKSSVAHADENDRAENICALSKSFAESLREEAALISSSQVQVCNLNPTFEFKPENGVTNPVLQSVLQVKSLNQTANLITLELEREIRSMVSDYPIATMTHAIAEQDRTVAAFLIGIAKKESDWGKHVPQKDGIDCYNYWGYKGKGGRGSAQGYACFTTPEEAVRTVGGRLSTLALDNHRSTPAKMIVWKCGSTCAGHSKEGVESWIKTVELYHTKLVAHTRG